TIRKVIKFKLLYYISGITGRDIDTMTEREVMEMYNMLKYQQMKEKREQDKARK
ncbi:unnamed protein product, partial [marine sediment metagenome]